MSVFDALLGRFQLVTGSIGKDRIRLRCVRNGDVFDEPPLIAIEHKNGRKIVAAVGRSASGFEGMSAITVHNPFESMEPLFADLDMASAVFLQAIRELFHARAFLAPRVALKLEGRHSPLSEEEKRLLQKFAKTSGSYRLYIFLDDQTIPADTELQHNKLVRIAHFATTIAS